MYQIKGKSKNVKSEKFWAAKDSLNQRVAISGREPEKRPDSGGNFAGTGVGIFYLI